LKKGDEAMTEIENVYGQVSPEQIAELEARRGVVLPEEYKQLLLRSNGGKPRPDTFDVPGWHGKASVVTRLYGIHSGKHGNLEKMIDLYEDRLPKDLLPIGGDPGGNLILLGVAGEHMGKIFFWDHEAELDKKGKSRKNMKNTFPLANDLGSFLSSLHANVD
jgi:hypothetical protein